MAKKDEKLHPALLYELRRIPKRVAAGVKLLSKHSGAPWWHHMTIKNLFMENGAACLIGQQPIEFVISPDDDAEDYIPGFGEDFSVKCEELGLIEDDEILEHGFISPAGWGKTQQDEYELMAAFGDDYYAPEVWIDIY